MALYWTIDSRQRSVDVVADGDVTMADAMGFFDAVEGANALSASNILNLEPRGIALVCLSALDCSTPAHIRYMIRRVRRRFPEAKILLGCWLVDADTALPADAVKADGMATTFRDAVRFCLDAASARPDITDPAVPREAAA